MKMNGFRGFYQTNFKFYFILMNMEQWHFKKILHYFFKFIKTNYDVEFITTFKKHTHTQKVRYRIMIYDHLK
jgi:hypothetical protein